MDTRMHGYGWSMDRRVDDDDDDADDADMDEWMGYDNDHISTPRVLGTEQ